MTMNDPNQAWINIPGDAKAAANLDQAELNAWRNGSGSVEDGVSDERCSNELSDEGSEYGDQDSIDSTDLLAEELVGNALRQAELRSRDLSEAYPFSLESQKLTHDIDDKHWAYQFCLLASLANEFDSQQGRHLRACFEVLVRDACKVFWGNSARAFRCGFPWDIYTPEHFRSAKATYSFLYKEVGDELDWKWGSRKGLPDNPSYRRAKDLGVDVVIWRSWDDSRGGQHYLLVQCATTEKEVLSKAADIKKCRLADYMIIPDTGYAKAIATPSCILNSAAIRDLSRQAGLVFDRSRIVKIACSEDWAQEVQPSQEDCIALISKLMPT